MQNFACQVVQSKSTEFAIPFLMGSYYVVGGDRGRGPGRVGGKRVREAGEERAGGGSSKRAGSRRNRGKLCNIA